MQKIREITNFTTDWVRLVGELLKDEDGNSLDYWRVEKEDSVIIIPFVQAKIVSPGMYYRPGIKEKTYDFPGGRIKEGETVKEAAERILAKELTSDVQSLELFTPGFYINSSFSNQKLYGAVAEVSGEFETEEPKQLLDKMHCLQCRCLLLEWMRGK